MPPVCLAASRGRVRYVHLQSKASGKKTQPAKRSLFNNSERARALIEGGERSRPSPQASGTAIVEKTERHSEVAGLSPLPPPARTEGARGRGGVLNLINTSQLTKKVLKTYSAKCVISGDHAETYEYHKAQTGCETGEARRSQRTEEKRGEIG